MSRPPHPDDPEDARPEDARPDDARLSAIVPTLNEHAKIAPQVEHLRRLDGVDEVIVVDGGSRDATATLARDAGATRVITSPPGRALQMNAGAQVARGQALIFVHADVRLPPDAARWVTRALADPAVVGGAFRTWTVAERWPPWLAPLLHLADLRSRYASLPYGDQAIFTRADTFAQVGGFPPLPLMEDLAFSQRLRRLGRIQIAPARVTVSGRRFEARPILYTTLVNTYPLLYRLGVPASTLARFYQAVR